MKTKTRSLLLLGAGGVLSAGLIFGYTFLSPAPSTLTQSSLSAQEPADTDTTTSVGPVAGPTSDMPSAVTGTVRETRLKLSEEALQTQLEGQFGFAPEWVKNSAKALMSGQDLPPIEDIALVTETFPAPTPTLETPSSLLRTALTFDRMDAVATFLKQGMPADVDQNIILWKVLEQWTPGTSRDHTGVLTLYIEQGGDVNIAHEEGFSAIELAATVSADVVLLLIENGASPWVHPDGYGAGMMERLSLHVEVPFVLDMLKIIANSPAIGPADTRALENTIGNLVDHYDQLVQAGAPIGVKDGKADGDMDPKIRQIAQIVMALSTLENTPWRFIPQEFVDMKENNLL